MTKILTFVIIATAATAIGLFLFVGLIFPDVIPDAVREDDTVSWHRQAAFLITATAWISAQLSVLFSIVLAANLWRQSSKTRRTH